MSRLPVTIRDRVAQGDDIFQLVTLPGGKTRIIPEPDVVYHEGTDINAELLQPWEDMYAALSVGQAFRLKTLWSGRVIRVNHRGHYDEAAIYNTYDYVVSALGYGFFAQRDNLFGVSPPTTADGNNSDWKPMKW